MNTINKLNIEIGPKIEEYLKSLNKNHTILAKELGNKYSYPTELRDPSNDGITIASEDTGAYFLNPASSFKFEQIKGTQALYRVLLSYEQGIRLATDNTNQQFGTLKMIVEKGIQLLEKRTGISRNDNTYGITFATCKIPGRGSEEYFLELSQSAGYELRIWMDCFKL